MKERQRAGLAAMLLAICTIQVMSMQSEPQVLELILVYLVAVIGALMVWARED